MTEQWAVVARKFPDRTAVTSPGCSYTFQQADRLSDHVAALLISEMADDDSPMAMFVGHTAPGLVALLAIMKTGRIFVVLDGHLPSVRLSTICEMAGTTTCLTDAANDAAAQNLGSPITRVITLENLLADAEAESRLSPAADTVAPVSRSGVDAASIVFTSGSTGRPKGVIQTHDQLLNDVYGNGSRFRITPEDRVALVLPYGFAAGLSLLFVALLNGAGVWCIDPREGGTRRLVTWIQDERLSTLHCTPHLLRSLCGVLNDATTLSTLRLVSTVGEATHGRDVAAIRPHLSPHCSFFNWTGSSEMGTLALYEIPGGSPLPEGTVPAGLPIANKEVQIRNEDGSLAAPHETGEILTISDYMSGGYWRDDDANADTFSFHSDGRKICQQGDLARFDDDGNLVLLGRSDAAIKIRGYLVEPTEIEAALLSFQEVAEAVVVPVVEPSAATRLMAFVVPDASRRTESPAALRRRLRERLPEYMVPATIVNVAEIPRNERGKVDRSQLPTVQVARPSAPSNSQWELVVADLWGEVLGLDFVGLDDDFMFLGGDSLSVEEMLVSVEERFGIPLVSSDLVEAPTLREFTRRVTLGSASLPTHPDVVALKSGGSLPPLFCFAGSGALALTFLPLSRHFVDRPVYAFQAHGLERRGVPDRSVKAAARRYLEIIRVLQPRGPYHLVGHSFGGLVALEAAHMLTGAGETVSFVVLFDTYLPHSVGKDPMEDLPREQQRSVAWSRKVSQLVKAHGPDVLPKGLPAVREWGRHARAHLAGVIPYSGTRQFDAFYDHGILVSRRYRVKPYGGRTVLIIAEANPDGADAWATLLTGSNDCVEVPSEHSSLLREPHATTLAELVNAEFAREPS